MRKLKIIKWDLKCSRPAILTLTILFISTSLFIACENSLNPDAENIGEFSLQAPYTYIRSQRDGGGVLISRLSPGEGFDGKVDLFVDANNNLNASIDSYTLDQTSQVAEITIHPNQNVDTTTYEIVLIASNSECTDSILYNVEIFEWPAYKNNTAVEKRDEIINWIEIEHPEFGTFTGRAWDSYLTYPQILIVSHYTFLNDDWEIRLCYHNMIPPHDWSYLRLRRRGEVEPLFAAKRESDGTIYEVLISEYPMMYDY